MEAPQQFPAPGTVVAMHCGDVLELTLQPSSPGSGSELAFLRTNLLGANVHRDELIRSVENGDPLSFRDWEDLPMEKSGDGRFKVHLPILETGRFEAKAYTLDSTSSEPVWAHGEGNFVLNVLPARMVQGQSIYGAFVRLFGESDEPTEDPEAFPHPSSGTFNDLRSQLDFIIGDLGFRSLLLLPVFPRSRTCPGKLPGNDASPYATRDFCSVDPRLCASDGRNTTEDSFQDFVDAVHARGADLLLDLPINHTGWDSRLQGEHPEWFKRDADGQFLSPGAWGVTWKDLVELDYNHKPLWEEMAKVFLHWCRRGVDGFRCDAGYKIPRQVWEYIVARVKREFPDTIFLLEGLGGEARVTEELLDRGTLDSAYSELFQKFEAEEIKTYLDLAKQIATTRGHLVHFAETHDNNRLASRSQQHARMRTSLAALCSESGAWGITCGVEWFADEKISVYERTGLRWGAPDNQCELIRRLNVITAHHPAMASGSRVEVSVHSDGMGLCIVRATPAEERRLLILVNFDPDSARTIAWSSKEGSSQAKSWTDLLTGESRQSEDDTTRLEPEQILCLSSHQEDMALIEIGISPGHNERSGQQEAARVGLAMHHFFDGTIPTENDAWSERLALLRTAPLSFCRSISRASRSKTVRWSWPRDAQREVMLPRGHVLLVECDHPFRCQVEQGTRVVRNTRSHPCMDGRHFALIEAPSTFGDYQIAFSVFEGGKETATRTSTRLLVPGGHGNELTSRRIEDRRRFSAELHAIATNGCGAVAQVRARWGELQSQYDALLSANLNPDMPSDRRVVFRRCRAWVQWRGYSRELNGDCLSAFEASPPGFTRWELQVPLGSGMNVALDIDLRMIADTNAIHLNFHRRIETVAAADATDDPVTLILRPDIEDRHYHDRTHQWDAKVDPMEPGFSFPIAGGHAFEIQATGESVAFISEPEWLQDVPQPSEAARGLAPSCDIFSPGYFKIDLRPAENCLLHASVIAAKEKQKAQRVSAGTFTESEGRISLERAASEALPQFIARRGNLKTVIAGYPWFLDWGRDSLITTRGMIAAGTSDQAWDVMKLFSGYEREGTLPNAIQAENDSDRHTSDAPLWLAVASSDLYRAGHREHLEETVDLDGRTFLRILCSIAEHYIAGTGNGIIMDEATGLIFSPSHYTWMDTNNPPATPREGYPVEIQALWYATLRHLAEVDEVTPKRWEKLAERVRASVCELFWLTDRGYFSDCLHADRNQPATDAIPDDHLRPNQLLAITLGLLDKSEMGTSIVEATRELLVPGAIRSLADRPVDHPLPYILGGRQLNDPDQPYWGRYTGPEDTSRKPAYHNGTAWTWMFPSWCEALVMTHGVQARAAALDYLASSAPLFEGACLGQLPEILDGNAPHTQRGCGAQAWAVSEWLRVSKWLRSPQKDPAAPNA